MSGLFPYYSSPTGRFRVDVDRITDTVTGRSTPHDSAAVAIITADLLDRMDLPGAPQDDATERLRCYEEISEDQRAEDDAARREAE